MRRRDEVLAKTKQVIDMLRRLPSDEVAVGWDEDLVKTWLPIFEKIYNTLEKPEPLPKEYESFSIARGLDFAGITAGRVSDLSVEIAKGLRELIAGGE